MIRYYEYESDSEGECPPTPEPLPLDSEYYCRGDECYNPYLENCPRYANIALEHYNSQHKHEVNFFIISVVSLFRMYYALLLNVE
jgi:hypothetical protein